MKNRLFSTILVISILAGLVCVPALADATQESEIKSVVQSFLQDYTTTSMLYDDNDLSVNTVSDASIPMPMSDDKVFKLSSGDATIAELQHNITYIEEKMEYFKRARLLHNISRTDLQLTYNYNDIYITGDTATVEVSEISTFYYTGQTQQSLIETTYIVDLVNLDGQWLIADITDNDWFDYEYKKDPTFTAQDAISKLETTMATESTSIVFDPDGGIAPATTAVHQIPYNPASATAYAYTYSRQDGSVPRSQFYNQDFKDFITNGDCMNFASQCIWAGFSGSQVRTSMDNHVLPMDN
ncbi:amidase domain-containing protein, partial [Dysgonomonas gadei]|uniref:amidase domain-containing protein n=1 Tax=Dysgonomonas gadei TaxID=156974 RepID=UPI003AF09DDB